LYRAGRYNLNEGLHLKTKLILAILLSSLFIRAIDGYLCEGATIKPSPNYLVILVHGIAENIDIFESDESGYLKPYLENSLNLPGYVYSYDFVDNVGSNVDAADELGNQMIPQAINDFKAWYAGKNHISVSKVPQSVIPQKVVLIAKSMGGLASRVYLTSDYYHDDVKKLITLDTPHLGSDAVVYKRLSWAPDTLTANGVYFTAGIGYIIYRMATKQPLWSDIYFYGALYAGVLSPAVIQPTLNNYVTKWKDPGCKELDSEGDFIKQLKGADILPNKAPIEYRLVSAHGFPSPDREGINNFHLLRGVPLINAIATPFDSRYWQLPTTQAKVISVVAAVPISGGTFVKDGSIVVDIDSAYGRGVKLFSQNTKRYDYLFQNDEMEKFFNEKVYQDYEYVLAAHAMTGFNQALNLMYLIPVADMGVHIANNLGPEINFGTVKYGRKDDENSLAYNMLAHHHLIEKVYSEGSPNIIDQALFDTPMATVTHLDTDVSTDEYNMTQKIVHTGVVQPVAILNTSEASDNPPYAADRSVSLIFNEGTTSEVEKYTSSMLVKVPVTQISGVIHDFKPLMLESFQISENFAAWQEFAPNTRAQKTDDKGFKYIECDVIKFHLKLDEWGRYTISGLNFAEGQNLIAFKLRNRAKYSSNQVCKVIQNTIPMQPSKFMPEQNYMTNNVYQKVGIEFNKSTYYEDAIGYINILSFMVDGQELSSEASISSVLLNPYHPVASVEYIPKEPLSDGEHSIVVNAKSDVGVSQAMLEISG
jgi:pimeloyl-ACP methyl ester carboxylesterase